MSRIAEVASSFCLALVVASTGFAKATNSSPALGVVSDPGNHPSFNAADYSNYRTGSGTSLIVGKLQIKDTDPQNPETCDGHQSLLYPNTPYTRWMIATWLRKIDGRHSTYTTLYPGDKDTDTWIPAYLSPETPRDDGSVLQFGHCDGSNSVTFTNVPAGNYIMVVQMQREYVRGASRPTGNVIVQTPNGEYPVQTNEATVTGHLGDGYVLVTHDALIVQAGRSYTIRSDNVFPAAHFLPNLNP